MGHFILWGWGGGVQQRVVWLQTVALLLNEGTRVRVVSSLGLSLPLFLLGRAWHILP